MSLRDTLLLGEALATLKSIPDNTYDSIVTDPPYGMSDHGAEDIIQALSAWIKSEVYTPRMKGGMMGRGWDAFVPGPELWKECYRVLKPGGHILAASSTRTQDLLGIALRLAGFECRDTVVWIKSGGFPKSVNIAKVVEAHLEHGRSDSTVTGDGSRDREDLHWSEFPKARKKNQPKSIGREEAKRYEGHGTALKPSHEPFLLFRKPLVGTIAENVLKHGTGGLNIDACRIAVGANEPDSGAMYYRNRGKEMPENEQSYFGAEGDRKVQCDPMPGGRWPGNVTFSHFPGCKKIGTRKVRAGTTYEPETNRQHTLYGGGIDSLGRICGYADKDGTETIPAWSCEDGCPVKSLDDQSGQTSVTGIRSKDSQDAEVRETVWGPRNHRSVEYPGDSGGASRFFMCTEPEKPQGEWECVQPKEMMEGEITFNNSSLDTSEMGMEEILEFGGSLVRGLRDCTHNTDKLAQPRNEHERVVGQIEQLDFPVCCPPCDRFYGEHARKLEASALASSQQLADALELVLGLVCSRSHSPENQPVYHPSNLGDAPVETKDPHRSLNRISAQVSLSQPSIGQGKGRQGTGEFLNEQSGQPDSTLESRISFVSSIAPSIPCCNEHICGGYRHLVASVVKSSARYLSISVVVGLKYYSGCPVAALDDQSGILKSGELNPGHKRGGSHEFGGLKEGVIDQSYGGDSGGASRFFFCAKASKKEKTADGKVPNKHISVKPLKLMRYLCRLVTPPGGHILDPFMGSGSTGVAAVQEGFKFTGIEMEKDSHKTAVARILLADNPLLWEDDLGDTDEGGTKEPVVEETKSLMNLLGIE